MTGYQPNNIYLGDASEIHRHVAPNSATLSVWSPPYFVGKEYDRRVWVKDAAWENSRWHSISYRAVDEFEYVYIFWKPGVSTPGVTT